MKKIIAMTALTGLIAVGCAHRDRDNNDRNMNRGGAYDNSSSSMQDKSSWSGSSGTRSSDQSSGSATTGTSSSSSSGASNNSDASKSSSPQK